MEGLLKGLLLLSSILIGIKGIRSSELHLMVNPTFIASYQDSHSSIILYRKHDDRYMLDVGNNSRLAVKQSRDEMLPKDLNVVYADPLNLNKRPRLNIDFDLRAAGRENQTEDAKTYLDSPEIAPWFNEAGLCNPYSYDAGDKYLVGGKKIAIEVSDHFLCYSDSSFQEQERRPKPQYCRYNSSRPDSYHIESLAAYVSPLEEGNFRIRILIIDEAAHVQNWLLEVENNLPVSLICGLDPFVIGDVDLHLYEKKKDVLLQKRRFDDKLLDEWAEHFKKSFIESITIYESSVFYSRGLYLNNENIIHSMGEHDWLQKNLFTLKQNEGYSVQAMEIYQRKEYRYVHIASIKDDKPHYYFCKLNKTFTLADRSFPRSFEIRDSFCTNWTRFIIGDEWLVVPIDFVYYNNDKCVDKLVALYNHVVRIFKGDTRAQDPDTKKIPYNSVKWMPAGLHAALFYEGLFYLFTSANRLLIQKRPRTGDCDEQLIKWNYDENEYIFTYGSQLIYQLEDWFSGKSRETISPYDGHRTIELAEDGFKFDPSTEPIPIEDKYVPLARGFRFLPEQVIIALLGIGALAILGILCCFVPSKSKSQPNDSSAKQEMAEVTTRTPEKLSAPRSRDGAGQPLQKQPSLTHKSTQSAESKPKKSPKTSEKDKAKDGSPLSSPKQNSKISK